MLNKQKTATSPVPRLTGLYFNLGVRFRAEKQRLFRVGRRSELEDVSRKEGRILLPGRRAITNTTEDTTKLLHHYYY